MFDVGGSYFAHWLPNVCVYVNNGIGLLIFKGQGKNALKVINWLGTPTF